MRHLEGPEAELQVVPPLVHGTSACFVVDLPACPAILIDRFWMTPWQRDLPFVCFMTQSRASLILRDLMTSGDVHPSAPAGSGPLHVEDVTGSGYLFGVGQGVWARQLNPEDHQPLITCDGSIVWLFGVKTEGLETVIDARNDARVDLIGGYILPIDAHAP